MRVVVLGLIGFLALQGADQKLTPEDRLEIVRGLTAEYATAKIVLPSSKNPLPFTTEGIVDQDKWDKAMKEREPSAKAGDIVQITKVEIDNDEIRLDINGGLSNGVKWYDRLQIGMGGNSDRPITASGTATTGTTVALRFKDGVPSMDAQDLKKMLQPYLDFEKRSATENYVETLPEPVQAAIKENRAVVGMKKDQVIIAMGRPRLKSRETKDGVEQEDWVYGLPPGKITFVTFEGDTVTKVKEDYAGLGGSVAPPLPPSY